jgi:hypothetical protein
MQVSNRKDNDFVLLGLVLVNDPVRKFFNKAPARSLT